MFNREQPMGVRSWLGFHLLMAIPIVNIVLLIVLLFHPDTNHSLKNYLLSFIVLLAIVGIIVLIILIIGILASYPKTDFLI
ncbi:MAG TPA: hypothetical protein VIK63_02140 [Haloplasmataceae bacterium]